MKTARIVVLAIVLGAGSVAPCLASGSEPARIATTPGQLAVDASVNSNTTRHQQRPDAINLVAGSVDSDRALPPKTQQRS